MRHKSLILELPDPFLPPRPPIYGRKRVGDARLDDDDDDDGDDDDYGDGDIEMTAS